MIRAAPEWVSYCFTQSGFGDGTGWGWRLDRFDARCRSSSTVPTPYASFWHLGALSIRGRLNRRLDFEGLAERNRYRALRLTIILTLGSLAIYGGLALNTSR